VKVKDSPEGPAYSDGENFKKGHTQTKVTSSF